MNFAIQKENDMKHTRSLQFYISLRTDNEIENRYGFILCSFTTKSLSLNSSFIYLVT